MSNKKPKTREKQLTNKLKSYSALTSAFLAAASGADAQILYHDVNPDVVLHNSDYSVDMDQDGMTDFILKQISVTSSGNNYQAAGISAPSSRLTNRVITKVISSSFFYADRLNAASPIGPAVTGWQTMQQGISYVFPLGINFSNSFYGFWGGQNGYLGVEFKTNGNTFYGWIECYVSVHADTLILKGFGYEAMPNTLINAGDSGTFTALAQQSTFNFIGNFYPNALKSNIAFIHIDAKENTDLNFEIMNGAGQVLLTEKKKLSIGKNILSLNASGLENGIYFVKVISEEKNFFRKIVVSR